jgi:hypothetical protein
LLKTLAVFTYYADYRELTGWIDSIFEITKESGCVVSLLERGIGGIGWQGPGIHIQDIFKKPFDYHRLHGLELGTLVLKGGDRNMELLKELRTLQCDRVDGVSIESVFALCPHLHTLRTRTDGMREMSTRKPKPPYPEYGDLRAIQ